MRNAIAMIELIFSLVVMGIVLMSAPMMISSSVKSSVVALQQEGINEAVSRVNMILTYPWDERDDTNTTCIPPVLTTQGDAKLNAAAGTLRRAGVPLASRAHSFQCQNLRFGASPLGTDPGDNNITDDLDDFTGGTTLRDANSGTGGVDYIEKTTIRIANQISYISDVAGYEKVSIPYTPGIALPAGQLTSNIKQIDITLTSSSSNSDLNKSIVFRAFSSNIGGIEYEGRTF